MNFLTGAPQESTLQENALQENAPQESAPQESSSQEAAPVGTVEWKIRSLSS